MKEEKVSLLNTGHPEFVSGAYKKILKQVQNDVN